MAIYPGIEYFKKEHNGVAVSGSYFDCKTYPIPITLSTSSCAERYRITQSQANQIDTGHMLFRCLSCDIGRAHAAMGGIPMRHPRMKDCFRCGRTDLRLIDRALCIGCFNRQREAVVGKNGKGSFPKQIASELRWVYAIVAANYDDGVSHFSDRPSFGMASIERLDDAAFWIQGVFTDPEEFNRMLASRMPGARVIEIEQSPTLLELHQANAPIHTKRCRRSHRLGTSQANA